MTRAPGASCSCAWTACAPATDLVRRLEAAERFLESQATILDEARSKSNDLLRSLRVYCFDPWESAAAVGNSMAATRSESTLCPEDATAINAKLATLRETCVALRAMSPLWR